MEKKKLASNTNVEIIRKRIASEKLIDHGFDNVTIGLVDGKPCATFSIGSDSATLELFDIVREKEKEEVISFNQAKHTRDMILICKHNLAEINMRIEDLKMKIYLKPHQSEDEAQRLIIAKNAIESTLRIISRDSEPEENHTA